MLGVRTSRVQFVRKVVAAAADRLSTPLNSRAYVNVRRLYITELMATIWR